MTDNNIDLYPTVAARIGDPGAYVPRKTTPSGEPMETVPRWAARAVLDGIQPTIDALTAAVQQTRTALTQSRQQAATYANEVGSLKAEVERMRAERDRLFNEGAAMLGVVGAAEAWRAQFSKPADTKLPRMAALIAAVDALPNDQEPCDTCSSTAGGCPECRMDGLTAEAVNA